MHAFAIGEWPWRRILGAGAATILHIAVIALLLRALIQPKGVAPLMPRETILYLAPLPPPLPEHDRPPAEMKAPAVQLPDYLSIIVPRVRDDNARSLEGLSRELFDCRIENLSKLSAEERERCAKRGLNPDDSVDFADHTGRSHDAARWAREKQRKNAPALLPCASTQSVYATLSTATLLCLANGAINGFDPDSSPIYGDKPAEDSHLPNNGDPPPIYTDPDH